MHLGGTRLRACTAPFSAYTFVSSTALLKEGTASSKGPPRLSKSQNIRFAAAMLRFKTFCICTAGKKSVPAANTMQRLERLLLDLRQVSPVLHTEDLLLGVFYTSSDKTVRLSSTLTQESFSDGLDTSIKAYLPGLQWTWQLVSFRSTSTFVNKKQIVKVDLPQ